MKVVVSNPGLGNHVRNTVQAYFESDTLEQFYSTFIIPNNSIFAKLSAAYPALKSKQFLDIPNTKIHKLILPEVTRLFASKFLGSALTDKVWEWSEHRFDSWVADHLNKSVDVFHGYEHASLSSLRKCTDLNIFSVYEQPSVHYKYFKDSVIQTLLEKEEYFKENFSELYDSDLSKKRNKRRDLELDNANLILCNSSYVKKSLIAGGVSELKIVVVPLGFPIVDKVDVVKSSKIRFLVSGNLSYLKGVHHILRVWKNNQDVFANHELVCIGNNTLDEKEWIGLPNNVYRKERMNSFDYLNELKNSDVLILNTYSDGFGMVMSEAMAYGKAVIATNNSAAPDILSNKESGLIVNVGQENELLDAMKYLIQNTNNLYNIKCNALEEAKNHTWEDYRTNLPRIIEDRLNNFRNA